MPDPIEIRPGDLIERPANLVPGATLKKPGLMQQMKEVMGMIKDMKSMASDLGIDVGSLLGAATQVNSNEPSNAALPPQTKAPSPTDQIKLLAAALRLRYGDITVGELIEKLKAEYGDKKLSSF